MPLDRPSACVVVIDRTGSVLLFRIEDPHDSKPPIRITPGGGVKPGESLGEAAARGSLKRRAPSLIPQSWASLSPSPEASGSSWPAPYSLDPFFVWRTERFEPSTAGWSRWSMNSTRHGGGGRSKRSTARTSPSCRPV